MKNVTRISTMEFVNINTLPSPQMGSWHFEEFGQDFCYGAKASTSRNPVFSTPPGSCAPKDVNDALEWSEQTSNFNDFDHLESFSDVILPDNISFGPDYLFRELKEESPLAAEGQKIFTASAQRLDTSPIFEWSQSPPDSPLSQKLPSVKIKLKRVKRPKTLKRSQKSFIDPQNNQFEFEIVEKAPSCGSDPINGQLQIIETESSQKILPDEFVLLNEPFQVVENDEMFNYGEHFALESFITSAAPISHKKSLPLISLRDAIDMGEADGFLDDLLNINVTGENSQININPESSEEIEFEDIHSPLSSTSINSFLPSPLFEYSDQGYSPSDLDPIDHSLLSPPNVEQNFNDIQIGEYAEKSSGSRKSKAKTFPPKLSNESRYLRKKEQNKLAALRYRLKKKQEDDSLSNTLRQEEEQREKLNKECSHLKQEIAIMKNLLREAFIAKKLIPKDYFSKQSS